MKFRDLRADEIECRIGMVKEKGLTLLLYKDARCDMNILDETVGEENWQRDHKEYKGNLFCGVSIWNDEKKQWITKWDCGTESYTEKEKGEASDSFKRACVNWGIGRELYTKIFIWIPNYMCAIEETDKKDNYGKTIYKCNDKFEVIDIKIENKRITALTIANAKTGVICFEWELDRSTQTEYIEDTIIDKATAKRLYEIMINKGITEDKITSTLQQGYGVNTVYELKASQYTLIMSKFKE